MSANMAARRAAKANRRKAIVADKRKAELAAGSLAAQVSAAVGAPIRHCLLTDGWRDTGMGTLILTRGATAAHLTMATFLLDTFCLGIKDVVFRQIDADELAMFLDAVAESGAPMSPVEPAFARKLTRDLAVWAKSIGFPPHRNFAVVERLFGTVDADTCTTEFEFGRDGKPLYMPGPLETVAQVRRRLEQVQSGGTDIDVTIMLEDAAYADIEGTVEAEVLGQD